MPRFLKPSAYCVILFVNTLLFDFLFTEETRDGQNAEEGEVVANGEDNTSAPSLRPDNLTPNQLIQFDVTPAFYLEHLPNGLHSENLNTKFCSIL